jgi:hypothetical protein
MYVHLPHSSLLVRRSRCSACNHHAHECSSGISSSSRALSPRLCSGKQQPWSRSIPTAAASSLSSKSRQAGAGAGRPSTSTSHPLPPPLTLYLHPSLTHCHTHPRHQLVDCHLSFTSRSRHCSECYCISFYFTQPRRLPSCTSSAPLIRQPSCWLERCVQVYCCTQVLRFITSLSHVP